MSAATFCTRCGRRRHGPDHATERGRRICTNLVLVAEQRAVDLVTGDSRLVKRYVPDTPQRTKANRTRWVHRDTLAAIDRSTQ